MSNNTGYPSIDLPQTKNSTFFEKNPIIPSVDIISILKLLSRKNRDLKAIDCNSLSATYQELLNDSHKLALAYKELGVKKGDIVTISLPSNYQAITSFFALNEIGAITTFIDTYSSINDICNYIGKYSSNIFINSDFSKEQNEEIKKKTNVRYIITLSTKLANIRNIDCNYKFNNSDTFLNFHTLGSLAKFQKDKLVLPNSGNDDSLILYTSGSTGKPKSVVLTNKNILAAQIYAGKTSHTENITGMKTMTCVPLRYPYGMVTSLLTSLLWGKEAIMTPDWDSNTASYYFSKKPNIIFGSPAVLAVTLGNLDKEEDLSYVSHFISGGDFLTKKLTDEAYKFFKEHNNEHLEIGNGFGTAEMVSICSTPVGVPLKQNTAGKILVGLTPLVIDREIRDSKPISGNDIEEKQINEVGELCISGKNVFKEYFGEKDKTECVKFIRGGKEFYRTGTIGFIDEDGYFTPTDRKSRFYIRSTGHKVYLDQVEQIVELTDDRIENCAVIKLPDEKELFICKAYISLKPGVIPSDDLKREIASKLLLPVNSYEGDVQLKEYEIPREIEFIESIPLIEGSLKKDYLLLEQMNNKSDLTLKLK